MPAEAVQVEVAFSARAGHMDWVTLKLPPGATLADALTASGLLGLHGLQPDQVQAGIWGKVKEPGTVLRARDRVEVYRPLQVDPKEARRHRYRKDKPARKLREA